MRQFRLGEFLLTDRPCIHGGVYGRCRLLGCKPAAKAKGKPS